MFVALATLAPLLPTVVYAEDNCSPVKRGLKADYDVVKFGSYYHPEPVSAEGASAGLCAGVIAQGILKVTSGHKTVKNWAEISTPLDGAAEIPLPNTYLAYCGGDRGKDKSPELDTAQEQEVRDQIQKAMDKIRDNEGKLTPDE